jgi:hypothetical protein
MYFLKLGDKTLKLISFWYYDIFEQEFFIEIPLRIFKIYK